MLDVLSWCVSHITGVFDMLCVGEDLLCLHWRCSLPTVTVDALFFSVLSISLLVSLPTDFCGFYS